VPREAVEFGGASGENAIAVISEGDQSIKRQRCTASVVGTLGVGEPSMPGRGTETAIFS
jgi:hypothetical protein